MLNGYVKIKIPLILVIYYQNFLIKRKTIYKKTKWNIYLAMLCSTCTDLFILLQEDFIRYY